ncbi:hypothetical protein HK105_208835 [Polyrhizophydium stewartii]|uniref:SET domain-containing protein n=1 Tax=Polyrhizophydium stewartii TaxID=2732419 RepID=A0ABR4MWQ1_9FUNG
MRRPRPPGQPHDATAPPKRLVRKRQSPRVGADRRLSCFPPQSLQQGTDPLVASNYNAKDLISPWGLRYCPGCKTLWCRDKNAVINMALRVLFYLNQPQQFDEEGKPMPKQDGPPHLTKAATATAADVAEASTRGAQLNAAERLAAIEEWMADNHIVYDRTRMRVRSSERGGFSVEALDDTSEDTVLCMIPKAAVLSVRNCAIADLLEECGLSGMLGLAVAIMFERSKGDSSPWGPYLAALPEHENIPMFWTETQLSELQGTGFASQLPIDIKNLEDDYAEHVAPLIAAHPDIFDKHASTLRCFMAATSIATSRAFNVDAFHGISIVPLADLFNHKTDAEHVHFENIGDVCEFCGESGGCGCELVHDEDEDEWEDDDDSEIEDGDANDSGQEDQDSDMPDAKPYAKRSKHKHDDACCDHDHDGSQDQDDDEDSRDAESCPSELYCSDDDASAESQDEFGHADMLETDLIEMRVVRPIKRGQEICNTYGTHSNAELLHRYGFAELGNQYSTAAIPSDDVVDFIAALHPDPKSLQPRLDFLNSQFPALMQELLSSIVVAERAKELEAKRARATEHAHREGGGGRDIDGDGSDDNGGSEDETDLDDEFDQEVDLDHLHINYDGQPSFVALALVSVLVASKALFSRWKRDPKTAFEYFMQVHRGIWSDSTLSTVASASSAAPAGGRMSKARGLPKSKGAERSRLASAGAGVSPTKLAVYKVFEKLCSERQQAFAGTAQQDDARARALMADLAGGAKDVEAAAVYATVLRAEERGILSRAVVVCRSAVGLA